MKAWMSCLSLVGNRLVYSFICWFIFLCVSWDSIIRKRYKFSYQEPRGKTGVEESAALWLQVAQINFGDVVIFAIQKSHLHIIIAMSHFAQLTGYQILFNESLGYFHSTTFIFFKKIKSMWYIVTWIIGPQWPNLLVPKDMIFLILWFSLANGILAMMIQAEALKRNVHWGLFHVILGLF